MSYDISLYIDDAKGDRHSVFDANHTMNTAIMWREAGCDLANFNMTRAVILIQVLGPALHEMKSRPTHFSQWNPDNGWGSYDSTVAFLSKILDACERWPMAIVHVSH